MRPPITGQIAVIIVGWNAAGWLYPCLASIQAHAPSLRVVYVDNASRDDSVEVARSFGGTLVVANRRNVGFTASANHGASVAAGLGADVLLFLNPDTLLTAGCIEALAQVVLSRDDVGIAGPLQIEYTRPGRTPTPTRPNSWSRIHASDAWRIDSPLRVEYVQGAALMVRRQLFDTLGGFSSLFPNYSQDKELCRRARNRGLEVLICPSAEIHHHWTDLSAQTFFRARHKWRSGLLYAAADPELALRARFASALRYVRSSFRAIDDRRVAVAAMTAAFAAAAVHLPSAARVRKHERNALLDVCVQNQLAKTGV